jgi:NAD(P)H-quinone oxidoreductase subunit 5
MHDYQDLPFRSLLLLLGPALFFLLGSFSSRLLNQKAEQAANCAVQLSMTVFGATLISTALLIVQGPFVSTLTRCGPASFTVIFDNLSAILLGLISFLAVVIVKYSKNYLDRDSNQGRFTKWLCLAIGSVMLLMISGNLLLLAIAWCSTSLCLHQLLVFYRDRPGSLLAARKKFIFSRIGDLCLLGVLILTYLQFHTWDIQEILDAARSLHHQGTASLNDTTAWIAFLLVGAALLKSAQFPFHSWLPDTMETPTPVSALMHAGLINAGGFLIVRFSPLVSLNSGALVLLAILGGFTALFASLTMLTHASIKRSLAFSTVAQMGFMMLECGLGAFSLAILHLVAHSLYKAHAFLASGDLQAISRSKWIPTGRSKVHPWILILTLITSSCLSFGVAWFVGISPFHDPRNFILIIILTISLSYLLWSYWNHGLNTMLLLGGVGLGALLTVLYLGLHQLFETLLASASPDTFSSWSSHEVVIAMLILPLFIGTLVLQVQLPQWEKTPLCSAIYVHARNGFYFTTLANRLVNAVWPLQSKSKTKISQLNQFQSF